MDISKFSWDKTPNIQKNLTEVEVLKKVFETIPLTTTITDILRSQSFINSAVSSAQIENIPSTVKLLRTEGANLKAAYQWIYSNANLDQLTVQAIKDLHMRTLKGLSGSAGQYRIEQWGVFNEGGTEIHHAPLHIHIPELMHETINFLNSKNEHPVIMAAVAQFIVEKIHPFADGNGRVGRLISAYILHKSGYGLSGIVPMEKYINAHRSLYYQVLEPSSSCTEFVDFFLEALIAQANEILQEIKNPPVEIDDEDLLPRRAELLEVLKDHPESSFDFLHRRFLNLHERTLHRDLKYLMQKELIKKLGSTRGAVYVAKSDIL